jgi:hypothetical protein
MWIREEWISVMYSQMGVFLVIVEGFVLFVLTLAMTLSMARKTTTTATTKGRYPSGQPTATSY